ncbi:MAG: hypothetical protein QM714_15920 [Nocardioides sp.]|uniref:hypothetical protein n=1 Tax=Nocardioides sp. TaxID=35761 RepID=UPI0039E506B6
MEVHAVLRHGELDGVRLLDGQRLRERGAPASSWTVRPLEPYATNYQWSAMLDPYELNEDAVSRIAVALRQMFRNRAERRLYKAASADLPALREDERWESLMSPAASGIASSDVDGYVAAADLPGLERAFLLMPAADDGNVVIHVLSEGQRAYPDSKLRLAADLADQRGAREELRAAELLREVSEEHGR